MNLRQMRTINLFAAGLLIVGMVPSTQAQSFEKGTSAINLGIGLGGYSYNYLRFYNNTIASPTFSASYDLGIAQLGPDILSVGLLAGHNWRTYKATSTGSTYTYIEKEGWRNTLIGLRAAYHFNWFHEIDKLDLYAGVMTGYSIGKHTDESTRTNRVTGVTEPWNQYNYVYNLNTPRIGAFVGVRYLFTNNFGVFAEAGYSVALINGGLTLKF